MATEKQRLEALRFKADWQAYRSFHSGSRVGLKRFIQEAHTRTAARAETFVLLTESRAEWLTNLEVGLWRDRWFTNRMMFESWTWGHFRGRTTYGHPSCEVMPENGQAFGSSVEFFQVTNPTLWRQWCYLLQEANNVVTSLPLARPRARRNSRPRTNQTAAYGRTIGRNFYAMGESGPVVKSSGLGGSFFGIELEFELNGMSQLDGVAIIRNRWTESFCDIKRDGSLDDGLEIATQPMTLEYFRQLDLTVLEELRQAGARAWDTTTCGVHIHLSRNSFKSKGHIWRFSKFIFGNRQEMRRVVGRDSSHYLQWNSSDFAAIGSVLKGARYQGTGHYCAVNLDNNATIEVRVFRSTLRAATLTRYIEFLHAAIEYTRDMSIEQVSLGALDYHAFTAWLADRTEFDTLANSLRFNGQEVAA